MCTHIYVMNGEKKRENLDIVIMFKKTGVI